MSFDLLRAATPRTVVKIARFALIGGGLALFVFMVGPFQELEQTLVP